MGSQIESRWEPGGDKKLSAKKCGQGGLWADVEKWKGEKREELFEG